MHTFLKLAFVLSVVTPLHCMQKEQKPVSKKTLQLIEAFGHQPVNVTAMMEFKKPEYFKKIFKLGEPIFRKKTGNIISFSQYGRTGSAVDGNHGSPFIRFNTKNAEITGYYECLERTGINEFAEWRESLQINQKSIEEIFRFLEKKYLYESESPVDREAKL